MEKIKYRNVFVRNDINGVPCMVGDRVKITREAINYTKGNVYSEEGEDIDLPEETWEGEIVLLLSKGICIKTTNGGYIHPKIIDRGHVKWTWEVIDKYV